MITEVKIERNILECFSYLLNLQLVLGSIRVAVKDRVIRSPNDRQNLYSLLFFLCSSFSQLYYQIYFFEHFYNKDSVFYSINVFGALAPYISYVTCLLIGRFTRQNENIEIFTKLQKIDRILSLQHDRYFTKFQARLQNFLTTLIVVLFPLGSIIYAIQSVDKPFYTIFVGPSYMTVYVDFLLIIGFLYYICVRMSILIKLLKNQIHRFGDEPQEELPFLIRWGFSLIYPNIDGIGEQSTLEPDKWVQCVAEILKTYQMFTHIFCFQIFNITATLFLWTFLAIGLIVSALITQRISFTATTLVGVWAIFYFVLLTAAALLNDWFLYQVKHTKLLCVRIMYYDYDDISRKAASRMLQTINQTDPKFDVYGVFTLNSSLLLTLIGVISTNVVVIIQFVVSKD